MMGNVLHSSFRRLSGRDEFVLILESRESFRFFRTASTRRFVTLSTFILHLLAVGGISAFFFSLLLGVVCGSEGSFCLRLCSKNSIFSI